jgi:hypothetical protein
MRSSSASFFAVVLIVISIVTAALLMSSNGIAFALLALTVGVGAAFSAFTLQNVLNQIEETRRDIEAFRTENMRSISTLETNFKNLKIESGSKPADLGTTSLPSSPLSSDSSTKSNSPTFSQNPVSEPKVQPISNQKDNYQPFSGLSLSSPSVPTPSASPLPSSPLSNSTSGQSSQLDFIADDPNKTNASIPLAARSSVTSANPAVSHTTSHENIPEMESTQSFLPPINKGDWSASSTSQNNLSPEATLGFASNSIPPVDPNQLSSYLEKAAPKAPSKTHSKIKKRYSTFAGLALNDENSADSEMNKYKEDLLTPPPAPPPPSQIKEKKRYSTFAGLALNERSKGSSQQPASNPSNYAYGSSNQPPAKAGSPLSILSPSTVTNLGFSKNTDGMGVPKEEIVNNPVNAPAISPSSAHSAAKGARKRYQTFMGLSLSKTPQPIKRFEEPPPMEATAPLAVSIPKPSYSNVAPASAPAPSAMQAAINRGQQGNLVDGFCSLCGSPQAAANDYASSGSEPEFCWYCGAKLRN